MWSSEAATGLSVQSTDIILRPNMPFLILEIRHPAVTGVYWIVGVVVVKCSNI